MPPSLVKLKITSLLLQLFKEKNTKCQGTHTHAHLGLRALYGTAVTLYTARSEIPLPTQVYLTHLNDFYQKISTASQSQRKFFLKEKESSDSKLHF